MKLKKVLLGATAVALTAAVSIGATLAYLTDSDEDVNVMTLGNVYIDQIEQERVDDNAAQDQLVDFEQNQPLLPAVYPGKSELELAPESEWVVAGDPAWSVLEDNTNVIDKFVTVKNTGKSDAYIRTIFAFEEDSSLIHRVINSDNVTKGGTWVWEENVGTIVRDGVTYSLWVATYTEAVKPGVTTIPSLKQIYMDKTATNEYCEKLGDTYDILVYSQAVQTEGFDGPDAALDKAFGAVSSTNNPWVSMNDVLTDGGNVSLAVDTIVTDESAAAKYIITKDTVMDFGDNTLTLKLPNATGATANWVGVNVEGGNVVFEGATGGITTADNPELYAIVVRNGANLTINGGKYIGGTSAISVTAGTVTINGGYFANQTDDAEYLLNCYDSAYKNGTASIIVKGGSFLNWNPADNAAEGVGTSFVAEGYTVVAKEVADGILYTVVEGVADVMAEGGKVTLSSDVKVTDESAAAKNIITKDTVLNFGDNTVTLDIPGATADTENWIGVEVLGGNVVFDAANGGITTSANSDLFCSYVRNGATLTINDGTYIGGGSCVQVREGTLIVNGGYFEVSNPEADYRYVLNCTDANYKAGTAQIIVQGGSFLNWNPADNAAEGAGTNFLAPGYTVVEEAVADGTLYTVVKA